ncbi:hypothetical protein GAYE_SCF68G6943 [Galdieria yellowstonensis]|uniref:Major facilitator superfamily (MFS) profile domain-containing protein n=1 Tax=Galdieria yellowstonensis TaxID=3028027 RepID=A0AAV9INP8_9RHOD|nr:hypothetical protein GAYE_SCF68G6943 [Galdieria yellowstonensis]
MNSEEKCGLEDCIPTHFNENQIKEDLKVQMVDESKKIPSGQEVKLTTSAINANRLGTALGFLSNGYQYEVTGVLNLLFQLEYGSQYSLFLESSLTSALLFGVLIGQLFFGMVADIQGRKAGLVITSSFVVLGAILATASYGTSVNGLFWMMIIGRGVTGFGMGGEYTCAVTNAMEDSEQISVVHRGKRTGLLVLCVEVLGNTTPLVIQLILVAALHRRNSELIWRLSYGIGIIPCLVVLFYRLRMRDSAIYSESKASSSYRNQWKDMLIVWRGYWPCILGSAITWFIRDFETFSIGSFGASILHEIEGASLFTATWISLLTAALMVLEPLASSFLIDTLGRRNVQLIGWLSLASVIAITGGTYPLLFHHAAVYVFLSIVRAALQYFLAVSIYLTPNEIFPTMYRARLYGLCSAFGKAGAAIGVHVFLSMQQSFGGGTKGLRGIQYFDAAFAVLGFFVALLLVPELKKTSLHKCDVNFMEMCEEARSDSKGGSKVSAIVKECMAYKLFKKIQVGETFPESI